VRTEAQIGSTSKVGTELYQPIEPREWLFVQPFANFERSELDIFRGHDRVARYDKDQDARRHVAGREHLERGAVARRHRLLEPRAGPAPRADPTEFGSEQLSVAVYETAEFEYDTLDSVTIPER